ncbi:MAG: HAD family hydrolase [Planctomycetota bacterium]
MRPPYDLLAIDLDGTLLMPGGGVSAANVDAIVRARDAGIAVTICTGRGLAESRAAIEQITQEAPVAVAGGAILADPVTGATLHRYPMDADLALDLTHAINRAGHAAIVLKDAHAAGYDYLVVGGPDGLDVDPLTRWWFKKMGVEVRRARQLEEDEHPEHTLRVGLCGGESLVHPAETALHEIARGRAATHTFTALAPTPAQEGGVLQGDDLPAFDEPVVLVEAFDLAVNKWEAVRWIARELGLDGARIAAIGDEVNDARMIRSATLGVAMGNAVPDVLAVADRVAPKNADDGVAHAIDRILAGEW